MEAYIIICGCEYSELDIEKAFDSLDKAKNYYKETYGLKKSEWTYNDKDDYYFYDGDTRSAYENHLRNVFQIVHRVVE